jgi:hypothetical protein
MDGDVMLKERVKPHPTGEQPHAAAVHERQQAQARPQDCIQQGTPDCCLEHLLASARFACHKDTNTNALLDGWFSVLGWRYQ